MRMSFIPNCNKNSNYYQTRSNNVNNMQYMNIQERKQEVIPYFKGGTASEISFTIPKKFIPIQKNITAGFDKENFVKLISNEPKIVEKISSWLDKNNNPIIRNGKILETCVEAYKIDSKKLNNLLNIFNKNGESIFASSVDKFFKLEKQNSSAKYTDIDLQVVKNILKLDKNYDSNDILVLIKPFMRNEKIISEMAAAVNEKGDKVFTVPEIVGYSKLYEKDKSTITEFSKLTDSKGRKLLKGGFEDKKFISEILPKNVKVFKNFQNDYADLSKRDFGFDILQDEEFVKKYSGNKKILNEIPCIQNFEGIQRYKDPRDMVELADIYIEDSATVKNLVKDINRNLTAKEIKELYKSYKQNPKETKILMELKDIKVDLITGINYFEYGVDASEVKTLLQNKDIAKIANDISDLNPIIIKENNRLADLDLKVKDLDFKLKRSEDNDKRTSLEQEKAKLCSNIDRITQNCITLEKKLRKLSMLIDKEIKKVKE